MEEKPISIYQHSVLATALKAVLSDYLLDGLAIKKEAEQHDGILFKIALMDRERECFSMRHLLPLVNFCQNHNLNLKIQSNSRLNITIK